MVWPLPKSKTSDLVALLRDHSWPFAAARGAFTCIRLIRWAALALKSPLGEWSCICVYVCVTGRCPYLLCVSQFCVRRFTSCKLIKPKIKFANLLIIFAVFSPFFTKKSFVLQQEPIREPPSLLISWVNPFPSRLTNRTIFFCKALESHECACCLLSVLYFHWLFPLSARETSPGSRSIYKSTRERVDSNGLYGRCRLHLMTSWLQLFIFNKNGESPFEGLLGGPCSLLKLPCVLMFPQFFRNESSGLPYGSPNVPDKNHFEPFYIFS